MTDTLQLRRRGDRAIEMVRRFDAPRERVFAAYTQPELLKRWLGPRGWALEVCDIDLRPGGTYRFVGRHSGQEAEMGWGGVYREVEAPQRLVATERFDQAWYPGEALLTLDLADEGDQTVLTVIADYESAAAREAVLATPMEAGLAESYDRLAELLASSDVGRGPADAGQLRT